MNNPVKNWRDTKKLNQYLGQTVKLLVWTKITGAPTGFEYQTPYFVGIVETLNKIKLPLQIVDCTESDLKTGLKLKLVIRRTNKPQANDVINYGLKAVPLLQ